MSGAALVETKRAASLAVSAHVESFHYGSVPTLRDIRITLEVGGVLAILGPSGCGKSTLLRIIAGLVPRARGDRFVGDVRLFGDAPLRARSDGRLAMMFQDPTLLPHLTVRENVALPLRFLEGRASLSIEDTLRQVGLERYANYLPRDLSGGMKTRVALARSFISQPDLLLLDEPFTGLDIGWREDLYRTLRELRERVGTTVLLVTHDLEEAVFNAERLLVMSSDGAVLDTISPEGDFPRPYSFGSTVGEQTALLERLAIMLSPSRRAAEQ